MFPKMTKKLFDEKERIYQITVICIRLDELQTKGAVLQKMGKPTKNGTKMTFAPVQSAGEYEAEMQSREWRNIWLMNTRATGC